jgi:hypothetical protein
LTEIVLKTNNGLEPKELKQVFSSTKDHLNNLQIKSVKYGKKDIYVDVTSIVISHFKKGNHSMLVENKILQDPIPGVVKELVITLLDNSTLVYNEHTRVHLDGLSFKTESTPKKMEVDLVPSKLTHNIIFIDTFIVGVASSSWYMSIIRNYKNILTNYGYNVINKQITTSYPKIDNQLFDDLLESKHINNIYIFTPLDFAMFINTIRKKFVNFWII